MTEKHGVQALTCEDIMTQDVQCVTLNQTIKEIIQLFIDKQISGAPVVDGSRKLISIITEADLMKLAAKHGMDQPLKTFLQQLAKMEHVIVVRKVDPFVEVFKQFLTKPVRRVIVVDGTNKVHGVVSRRNILKAFLQTQELEKEALEGEEDKKE